MSDTAPRRVLVLRPEPGNADTVARLAMLGVAATPLPLFGVESVEWTPPSVETFDALLLTSANALRYGGAGLAALATLPAWCVGEATAGAARKAGLTVGRVGAEGVAALLSGTSERLLWLCGEQRTSLPARHQRRVTAIPVYRTIDLPFPAGAFDRSCLALLHSTRAARRLATLVAPAAARARVAIVAISPDVAASAGEGWRGVAVASRPDDAEMVAIAAKLCQDSNRGVRQ